MKIYASFKDPDAIGIGFEIAREKTPISEEEETKFYTEICRPWLQWGEQVVIEFDSETQTAKVVRQS